MMPGEFRIVVTADVGRERRGHPNAIGPGTALHNIGGFSPR
jgi:hypothetical protein